MTTNPCPHARSAAEFITSRAIMGREKYGHTLADAALSPAALVRHAREESADLLVYLTGLEAGMADERSVADRMRDPETQADAAMERAQRSGDETAAATWAMASAVFALRDALTPPRVERSGHYECLSDKPSGTWDEAFKPEPTRPAVTREDVMRVITATGYSNCLPDGGSCLSEERCSCARTIDAIMALIGGAP